MNTWLENAVMTCIKNAPYLRRVHMVKRDDIADWCLETGEWTHDNELDKYRLSFLMAEVYVWVLNGLPSVRLSDRHAAALLSTSYPDSYIKTLKLPFTAFRIEVPECAQVCGIKYYLISEQNGYMAISRHHEDGGASTIGNVTWDEICYHTKDDIIPSSVQTSDTPLDIYWTQIEVVKKLLIGICIQFMQPGAPRVERYPITPRNGRIRGKEFPTCNTYTLVADVKVDCVQVVKDWIQGKRRGPLTIQSLVRGHWKRVAIGAGRLDRAWRWIQPYWKGPEDAPIAVRSHVLGAPE